ncbi:MAG: three-Cys-motif partner protein TcmP [Sulfurimonas sp.]|nr:three-Cys-motif partner protein TcmP [Sulfurimonas sp.]
MATNKQETKNNIFEHSQAKLNFYKNYLVKYLVILLNDVHTKQINIYDIFCGIGIYADGNQGSPVIAMEIIKELTEKYPLKKITLTINDKEKSKVDFVSNYIDEKYKNICNVSSFNLDAVKMLKNVNEDIKKTKKGIKNLVFIDPYGYKEIYKDDILNIMNSKNSEIILFLPIAQMYRFSDSALTDEENNSYKHLRRFIKEFFDENHPFHTEQSKNQLKYIGFIKEAVSFNDKYFSASYSIQRDSKNYYALFFITNHIYGLDRIIDTKWKLDNNCGEGFKKEKTINLFTDIFEEENKENCLEKLEIKLLEYLKELRTNNELYKFTLKAGYMPKQINEILKILKKNNKLKFSDDKTNNYFYIAWQYYKDNDIRYEVKIIE